MSQQRIEHGAERAVSADEDPAAAVVHEHEHEHADDATADDETSGAETAGVEHLRRTTSSAKKLQSERAGGGESGEPRQVHRTTAYLPARI